jgi:ubiquinone/menaquinone biosynthesis C-methylase UbiE
MGKHLAGSQKVVIFTLQDWHNRYKQQASWTSEVRSYLLRKIDLQPSDRVLEVGSGTGVITRELAKRTNSITFGGDNDFPRSRFASEYDPKSHFICTDGLKLPLPNSQFSLTCCHYYLLWIKDQKAAIAEMARVTKNDGYVMLFAEPDHAARIDHPEMFIPYGRIQTDTLVKQGIDPIAGRKIGDLLSACGVQDVEIGQLQWQLDKPNFASALAEWNVAAEDLRAILSPEQIKIYLDYEKKSWEESSRIRIIPTFYAMGKVKK